MPKPKRRASSSLRQYRKRASRAHSTSTSAISGQRKIDLRGLKPQLLLLSAVLISFLGRNVLRSSSQQPRGLPQVDIYHGDSGDVGMPSAKIVGGRQVRRGRYKYAVSLQCNKVHYCGASLISVDTVLTAAHCVSFCALSRATAVIGTTDLKRTERGFERIDVAEFIVHPGYQPDRFISDIAVIKLAAESKHTPVLLDDGSRPLNEGQDVTVVGWGVLDWDAADPSLLLQELALRYMSPKTCAKHWPFTSESYLCAWVGVKKPIDSSYGDSGGPLIQGSGYEGDRHIQVGVTSFGTNDPERFPGKPSVYSRVSNAREFIEENSNGVKFVRPPRAPSSGGMLYLILVATFIVIAFAFAAPQWVEFSVDYVKARMKEYQKLMKR